MKNAPRLPSLRSVGVAAVALALVIVAPQSSYAAADPVLLGTADSFAVLAGTTITNTGNSVISGDIGLAPGSSVTGFPPGTQIAGAAYVANPVAVQAKNDANAALIAAAAQPGVPPAPILLASPELSGLTLTPDLYQSPSTLELNGTLILDGSADPSAIFVLRSLSTLITGPGSQIQLAPGTNPCNIYWVVPSSATLGTNSVFFGTILADTSITANTGASVEGRLFAMTGAVTLADTDVTSTNCARPRLNDGTGITIEQAVINSAPPRLASTGANVDLPLGLALALFLGGVVLIARRRGARSAVQGAGH